MIITGITELTKSRSKVEIDGEFAFVLYKGELRSFKIKIGNEITEDTYREITEKILPKRAKLRCMNLLKSRDYTTKQMERKLIEGFFPRQAIEEAIDYVTGYGYLDDERYARQYIEYYATTKSRRKLLLDLTQKGIEKDLIQRLFYELEEESKMTDETVLIENILKKKHLEPASMDYKERQKIMAHLNRKGFSSEQIRKVMGQYMEEYLT